MLTAPIGMALRHRQAHPARSGCTAHTPHQSPSPSLLPSQSSVDACHHMYTKAAHTQGAPQLTATTSHGVLSTPIAPIGTALRHTQAHLVRSGCTAPPHHQSPSQSLHQSPANVSPCSGTKAASTLAQPLWTARGLGVLSMMTALMAATMARKVKPPLPTRSGCMSR